ncbi:MAG: toll/interleukin-1 receptor domain-containing protein [Candidatus Delongbacteria bacterium]|jgi:hypothetical protein|nr:toll/interleukin-1 receptor domain-containing protein [Candidatus Delongbacteria bacterium]
MIRPKVFISYNWETPKQDDWVETLAEKLVDSNVDVIFDKYDLKEGENAKEFLEDSITDIDTDKVLIICSKRYLTDEGAQIITKELFEKINNDKFIVVFSEKDDDGNPYIPDFYKLRSYIDLSNDDTYSKNFEKLLRWVHDRPVYIKPNFGESISFSEDEKFSLETTDLYTSAKKAIKEGRPNAIGLVTEYLNVFSTNLEKFRIDLEEGDEEYDEKIFSSGDEYFIYKNEFVELVYMIGQYMFDDFIGKRMHDFFQTLTKYLVFPEDYEYKHKCGLDIFKFFIHELFLYCIAALMKHDRYDLIVDLIQDRYYIKKDNNGLEQLQGFEIFHNHLSSFEYRNERLKLGRKSLHADILMKHSRSDYVTFNELLQTDFILYLVNCVQSLRFGHEQGWFPESLVLMNFPDRPFDIFSRCESRHYFDTIKKILGVVKKMELEAVLESMDEEEIYVPEWGDFRIDPYALLNFRDMCTMP